MKQETQLQIIIKQLKKTGRISRNWCLQKYITRLGARMSDIKKAGIKFSAGYQDGDYVYILRSKLK